MTNAGGIWPVRHAQVRRRTGAGTMPWPSRSFGALKTQWPNGMVVITRAGPTRGCHPQVRARAGENDVGLVFPPAYGSWLNRIESESAALRYYTLNGAGHRTHDEQNAMIGACLRRRNARAR